MSSNFFIGPVGDGLRKDAKPWATPQDSFETMINAYQFRGRVVRRPGYSACPNPMGKGRLSIDGGTTFTGLPVMGLRTYENYGLELQTLVAFDTQYAYELSGNNFTLLPSVMPVTWSGANWQFFWTINYAGSFWATNGKSGINGWVVQSFSGQAGTGVGATVNVTAAGNTVAIGDAVYFINITGAAALNNLIFATVTSTGTTFTISATSFPPGVNAFVNGAASTGLVMDSMQTVAGQDGIRYYGILTNGTGWANYNPPIDPNNVLAGCLLMFAYRGYLVFLNTYEGNDGGVQNFGNRARWTQIGTPYYSLPVPVFPNTQSADPLTARDDLFGRGGANDAPTSEVIIGANFIRDVLVVYFERSTWRLRFVNNAQNPFVWERINVELGCSSTFSTIPFDKGLMAISNRGIVISDANDTKRIDEKIPDDFFDIRQTNQGLQRVYGIRTFRSKLAYWTFPSTDVDLGTFPDKVLVYNYETGNWSYFDDTFTCFGYYYPSGTGLRWEDLTEDWSSYTTTSWNSGVAEAGYENIVAGNQQGYVFLLEEGIQNSPSLLITALTAANPAVFTSPNHNLQTLPPESQSTGVWVTLSGIVGTTLSDGVSMNGRNFRILQIIDANTFTLSEFEPIYPAINAVGTMYPIPPAKYFIPWKNIFPGSIQINIGALVFTDRNFDGILYETAGLGSGTINYDTGQLNLTFNPAIGSTPVIIRVVTLDPDQQLDYPVATIGTYTANSGQIAKISGYNVQTKIFNFFPQDARTRLSKIDFYVDSTTYGQFTVNVFPDSSNIMGNQPLPDNLFSNIVTTYPTQYQIGTGNEVISRIFADVLAQTFQLQFTLTDQQMAINKINDADITIQAMMITARPGGRLV